MPRLAHRFAALRRFGRAREGATAVEFAIVAIPMLMMIFGMIELGLVLLVSTTLDTATDFATRNIRTGVFQSGADKSHTEFKNQVCANMTWLKNSCASGLSVESETFDEFDDANDAPLIDPTTFNPQGAPRCWAVGNAGSIVTPLLNSALVNGGAGSDTRLLTAATVFRNEPYTSDPTEAADC
jgi:Flp pilus assembly protein TadG